MWILSCKLTHLFKMMHHLYFRRCVNFIWYTYCNWTVDEWSHICTYFFQKKPLIFSTYFLQLILRILLKINLSIRNNFSWWLTCFPKNVGHKFTRVLCFDIYAIPTMCTPYYKSRLNLVSEICLVNLLTLSAWGLTVIF